MGLTETYKISCFKTPPCPQAQPLELEYAFMGAHKRLMLAKAGNQTSNFRRGVKKTALSDLPPFTAHSTCSELLKLENFSISRHFHGSYQFFHLQSRKLTVEASSVARFCNGSSLAVRYARRACNGRSCSPVLPGAP